MYILLYDMHIQENICLMYIFNIIFNIDISRSTLSINDIKLEDNIIV